MISKGRPILKSSLLRIEKHKSKNQAYPSGKILGWAEDGYLQKPPWLFHF